MSRTSYLSCLRTVQKMLKRKDASPSKETTNETTAAQSEKKQKTKQQSSLSAWIKKPTKEQVQLNITKRLGTEVDEVLRLEFETMDKEWISALSTEIQKPYFLEVSIILKRLKKIGFFIYMRFFCLRASRILFVFAKKKKKTRS